MRHVIDRSLSGVFDPALEKGSPASVGGGVESLRRVLGSARFFAGDDIQFEGVAESASTVMPGQLVVYRIGKDCPSRLVAEAAARGAAGILTEQVLPCPLPQCIVGDVEIALADITARQLEHPDRKLLTVGVVGSAGKTTTALLVASLFRGGGIRTGYQTDLGDCDGIVQSTADSAIPTHAAMVQWISEARDSGCRAAIIELSDDAARHGAYDSIQFDLLIITGSATSNADFGESGVQCALDRLTSTGVVIAPTDDDTVMRLVRDSGVRAVTYGVRKSADVSANIIEQADDMTTLLMTHENVTAVMESSLCGPAMAANHAAATAAGLLIAQPLHEIVQRLSELREIPGRGQRLAGYGQAKVVLDECGSPDRARATMGTVRAMKGSGRLWCVLAIDADDAPDRLARYGQLIERFADQAVITASRETKPKFLSASHCVLDGVQECAAMRLVADHRRAISWALSEARPDDTVLILGGMGGGTPHQRRDEIHSVSEFVQQQREANEPAKPPVNDPTILKMADFKK